MKILGLLRHAKSDWEDMAKRDFDRGLNDRGRRGAELIGSHILDHGISWDRIVASPAERVKQTLASALPDIDTKYDSRLYLASAETLIDVLHEGASEQKALMLCGHNPGMQELLFALVPPSRENELFDQAATKFPTATYAVFELDIDNWSELKEGCGSLVHFARPRDLDPELGPEH
ncbi:SixA phosphatase family protein [Altererythrobacter sp. MF3-039]|uniref:SixA phosphatase family protein n=1 Tax=Altererythrobacter sp. MF3-039 TaxID=3252901 RepID=UPI00390CB9A4